MAVTHADEVPRGMQRAVEVVKARLVEWLLVGHPNHIVAEGNEGHVDGFDPAKQIRINRSCQNESVNQTMLLKNRRQVDPIRRGSRRIMQRGEEYVLFQAGGIGFDALQDARMKGMKKVAVAQEEANHFLAPLENSACLRIWAESETPDGLKHARTRLPAQLRTGIQHARDCSNANGRGLGTLANRRFLWNCFHDREAFCRFGAVLGSVRSPPTLSAGKSSIPAPR